MWTIRFAKSRMRESRTSGVLWGVYDRKGCTYSTFGLYERLARWKRRKDYYNKMDNDIPENQQDREIAVSDIKHLDQSKKEKILWLQLFLFLKKIGFMKNLELFYLEIRLSDPSRQPTPPDNLKFIVIHNSSVSFPALCLVCGLLYGSPCWVWIQCGPF